MQYRQQINKCFARPLNRNHQVFRHLSSGKTAKYTNNNTSQGDEAKEEQEENEDETQQREAATTEASNRTSEQKKNFHNSIIRESKE